MKPKYLFLLLLAASVGGAALLYSDDVSFSTSEAAGYAVAIDHLSGPRALMIGETVRLYWPWTYRGTDSSPVTIALHHEFSSGETEVATIGTNIIGRRFRWTVDHSCCKAGLPAGGSNYLGSTFVVTKGQDNNIYSPPFKFISTTDDSVYNSEAGAQILTLQNQIVALQNENESLQSVIDGLLVQIQQLQAQLIDLTQ